MRQPARASPRADSGRTVLANDLGYSYVGLLTGEDGPGGYPGSCLGADVLSRRTFVIAPYRPFQVEQPWFSMYDRSDIPDSLPAAEREPGFIRRQSDNGAGSVRSPRECGGR